MWRAASSNISTKLRGRVCRRPGRRKLCTNAPPPPPPPPPVIEDPPRKGGFLLKFLGLTTVAATGVVGYAYYDPNFRKTIEDNIPYTKEAFDYLFSFVSSEKQTPDPTPFPKKKAVKEEVVASPALPATTDVKVEPKEIKAPETKAVVSQKSEKQRQKEEAARLRQEKKKAEEEEKLLKKAEIERQLRDKEAKEAAENAALEAMLQKFSTLVKQKAEDAMTAQKELIEKIASHTEMLKKAMDDAEEIMEKDLQWQNVTEAFANRQELTDTAEKLTQAAREELKEMTKAITDAKENAVLKKNKALKTAQETVNNLTKELNKVTNQVSKCESDSKVLLKYKDLIDKGKKQFQAEMDSLMPDVKRAKGKKLNTEELNSMIAYCQRRIEQLTKKVAEQVAMEQQRLELALDQQRAEDENFAKQLVENELQNARVEFDKELEKKETEVRVECEQERRQEMARKEKAHIEHIRDILKIREKELAKEFEKQLNMSLLHERQSFQTELSGWMARIRGIEKAIEDRAEAEKSLREAQELWLACVALRASIEDGSLKKGEWEEQLRPLKSEIRAVEEASGNHPFVIMVLDTIPEDALKKGVWTEENLQARFWNVRRVCKRVAMIGEEGGSLYRYLVSYLQSFIVWGEVVYAKETDQVDIDKLDTFTILANAQHWIKKGNFEQAVRFMNQLKGEPRRVAEDWLREAKLLLETRQAVYTLIAFASASGIGTFY